MTNHPGAKQNSALIKADIKPLKIGLLGMADNLATRIVLVELERQGIEIAALVLQKPDLSRQWRRVKRKITSGGFLATLKRVWQSILLKWRPSAFGENVVDLRKYPVFYTTDPNSEASAAFILERGLDLLLSSTDEMLKRRLFTAPKIATLNAHPGWVPSYRGLGSMARQVGDGYLPAVTVHVIDEGVDTGPVLLRRELDFAELSDPSAVVGILHVWQARCFAEVVKKIEQQQGELQFVDTFLEVSNMTRGMPQKKAALIMEKASRDPSSLRAF